MVEVTIAVTVGIRITSYNVCYTKLLRRDDKRKQASERDPADNAGDQGKALFARTHGGYGICGHSSLPPVIVTFSNCNVLNWITADSGKRADGFPRRASGFQIPRGRCPADP